MQSIRSNKSFIAERLRAVIPEREKRVYLCIGTENVLADSFGPRVGTILQNNMKKPIFVYGLVDNNINALNLVNAVSVIRTLHPKHKLVVVDAAVGDVSELGCVQVNPYGVRPGSATDKVLPQVGDYSIIGIVSLRGIKNFYSTDYDKQLLIEELTNKVADAIVASES